MRTTLSVRHKAEVGQGKVLVAAPIGIRINAALEQADFGMKDKCLCQTRAEIGNYEAWHSSAIQIGSHYQRLPVDQRKPSRGPYTLPLHSIALSRQSGSFDYHLSSITSSFVRITYPYNLFLPNTCSINLPSLSRHKMGTSAIFGFVLVAIAVIEIVNGQFASVGLSGFGNQFGQVGGFNQFSPVGQFGSFGQFGGQQFGNPYGVYAGNLYRQQAIQRRRRQLQYANFLRAQQLGQFGGLGGQFGGLGVGGLGQYGGLGFGGQQFNQIGGLGQYGGLGVGGLGQFGGQQFNQIGGQQFTQFGSQAGLARPPAGYVLASSTVGLGGGGFPIRSVDTSGDKKSQGSQIERVASDPLAVDQSKKPGCRSRSSSDGSWGHPLWWGWGDDCEEPAAKSDGVVGSQGTLTGANTAPQSQRMANMAGSPAEPLPYDTKMPMMPSYSPLNQPVYQRNIAPMGSEGLNSNINGLYHSGSPLHPSNELRGQPFGQSNPYGQIGRASGDASLIQNTTPQPEIANGRSQTSPGVDRNSNSPAGVIPEPYQAPQTYVPNQPSMILNQPTGIKPKQ
ncbi:hypothetical protein DFH28DRAFT_1134607 [Melampsora americana]|nr:hypothetical protein DFH28DRAFT_1134607 [Melampsora americana]